MRFRDRAQAGQELASMLIPWREQPVRVFGLLPGGVEVAFTVAYALGAPLDVMTAARLGAPDNPAFGIGAVAPGGTRIINHEAVQLAHIPYDVLEHLARAALARLEETLHRYRGGVPLPSLAQHTAILVDDGLSPVLMVRACIVALRRLGARRVVYASPVCGGYAARRLGQEVDALVQVASAEGFVAPDQWYRQFNPVNDARVLYLLWQNRQHLLAQSPLQS